jgi:hypothetical protein
MVVAVVAALIDAGVLAEPPRALLGGSQGDARHSARLHQHLQFVHELDAAAFSLRSQELAFLANVLVAGCSLLARPLTTGEAADAVAATCNLGLENWPVRWLGRSARGRSTADATTSLPEDFLASHDLATVFQVGWTVLHTRVSMLVAEQLLGVLAAISCADRETQFGLHVLRRELTKHRQAGAPWRARSALDVLAILDMPAWAALCALFDELPVMLANVGNSGASRPRSVSTSSFEFISDNSQIASVRLFMESLPRLLSG